MYIEMIRGVHYSWTVFVLEMIRNAKPRNRPSFRQIQMHLEIAAPDWINIPQKEFFQLQVFFLNKTAYARASKIY